MSFPQQAYPNDGNFQEASFPQEVTPPSVEPDVDTICVRYNPAWSPVLAAACDQLLQFTTWAGDDDAKKLAVSRATNLKILLQTPVECSDMSGCCTDVILHRINPETGRPEISTNEGETWIPDPLDPSFTAVALPPPIMDDHHTECDAATNGKQHIEDIISKTSDELGSGGVLLTIGLEIAVFILGLILAPEVSIPAMLPAIITAVGAAFALGQAGFDAYWTSDNRDIILCALFCHIGADGQFTSGGYDAAIGEMDTNLPASPAKEMVLSAIRAAGLTGLNNMCSYGSSADADCSACDCGTCVDNWDLSFPSDPIFGSITAKSEVEQSLTLVSGTVNGDGRYYVDIRTPDADTCCLYDHQVLLSGSLDQAGWQECGSVFDTGGLTVGLIVGHCVNHIQLRGTAPFTIKVFFIECP